MTAADLAAAWSRAEPVVSAHARLPPGAIDASTWATVASGDVAHRQSDEGTRGIGVLAESQAALWLAITDDHPVQVVSGLVQVAWNGGWAANKLLYERLDLPWPFQDRQWVVRTETNLAVAPSGAWERAWSNAPEELANARAKTSADAFDAALSIPTNQGSWILLPVSQNETLCIYQARVRLGGSLPAGAADRYADASLPELFRATLEDARSMHARYVSSCDQPGGDGVTIPCVPR